MSLIGDILNLAERLLHLSRREERIDGRLFREVIEPLHAGLGMIVKELLGIYGETGLKLAQLMHLHNGIHNAMAEVQRKKIFSGPGLATPEQQLEFGRSINRITADATELFLQEHGHAVALSLARFREWRAETRPARVTADAAACALLKRCMNRADKFSQLVVSFAWAVRLIVGRAHRLDPGRAPEPLFYKSVTSSVEDRLVEATTFFTYPVAASHRLSPDELSADLSDDEEGSEDKRILVPREYRNLTDLITAIGYDIQRSWGEAIYAYQELRVLLVGMDESGLGK